MGPLNVSRKIEAGSRSLRTGALSSVAVDPPQPRRNALDGKGSRATIVHFCFSDFDVGQDFKSQVKNTITLSPIFGNQSRMNAARSIEHGTKFSPKIQGKLSFPLFSSPCNCVYFASFEDDPINFIA